MTDPTSAPPVNDLGWLLRTFLDEVPGTRSALLAAPDGLRLAAVGLSRDQADGAAAMAVSLYSTAKASGAALDPSAAQQAGDQRLTARPGTVQQVLVQLDNGLVFVMRSTDGFPSADARQVGCLLGVYATLDADPGVVGERMAALVTSVAPHLVTQTRHDARLPTATSAGTGDDR